MAKTHSVQLALGKIESYAQTHSAHRLHYSNHYTLKTVTTFTLCTDAILGCSSSSAVLHLQGGPKNRTVFRLDNFVTVSPKKACSMSKFSKFYREKKVQNLHFSEFTKFAQIVTTAEIMLYMTRTDGFYSIYTNIQWNDCHFPTELVQMFHLVNVWNFATIHHLLQCSPICFSRTERRHIVHATLLLTCVKCAGVLWTGKLAAKQPGS